MARTIAAIVAGLVAWFAVATVLNLLLRAGLPGYREAEPSMQFTIGMMFARLAEGAVASLCAGLATAWVARANGAAVRWLVVLLMLLFIPVHYQLWASFPAWYHLTFLVSLCALTVAEATLGPRRVADGGASGR